MISIRNIKPNDAFAGGPVTWGSRQLGWCAPRGSGNRFVDRRPLQGAGATQKYPARATAGLIPANSDARFAR
ncbi:conserved hypothetical protein [Ricinus communis]|uniref:Uncharacterized protein n=1 Tax=Ricinus communis TaxID=3988 RepID=B9TF69_RICCO|nr:conserved hypothetical protein [Ricinus communis]